MNNQLLIEHIYVSTYCLHGLCTSCRLTCKICSVPCQHSCHVSGEKVTESEKQVDYAQ